MSSWFRLTDEERKYVFHYELRKADHAEQQRLLRIHSPNNWERVLLGLDERELDEFDERYTAGKALLTAIGYFIAIPMLVVVVELLLPITPQGPSVERIILGMVTVVAFSACFLSGLSSLHVAYLRPRWRDTVIAQAKHDEAISEAFRDAR